VAATEPAFHLRALGLPPGPIKLTMSGPQAYSFPVSERILIMAAGTINGRELDIDARSDQARGQRGHLLVCDQESPT
jgi:hypothetical protein